MPVYAYSVTKEVLWRGVQEQFSNVYHYYFPTGSVAATHESMLDSLKNAEKAAHVAAVKFVEGRAWGPIEQEISGRPDPVPSVFQAIRTWNEVGTMSAAAEVFRQLAVLVSWELPRSPSTGRKRFLKKFMRSGGLPLGATVPMQTGSALLTTSVMQPYQVFGNTVEDLNPDLASGLCAPNGDFPISGAIVRPYVSQHRFRY